MLPGMVGAVNYGTGKRAYDPSETIAGKTGTCIGQGGWVGLFTSYAPVEDPQLAIAVVGMGPDARQHATVAIAGQIYKALAYRFGKRGDKAPYRLTPDILAPRPKVDPSAVANVSEEDAEEKAAEQQEEAGTNVAPADADSGATTNVKPALKAINPNPATVTPRTTNAKPAPTPAGSTSLKKQAQTMDTRPRRVNPNEPQ